MTETQTKESPIHVNELTSEVTVTLDGHVFVLQATMPNVASLQSALNVPGLRMLNVLVGTADPRLAYHGLRCLCVSDNAEQVDTLMFPICAGDASEAVSTALTLGLPDEGDGSDPGDGEAGKDRGATMTQSPGAE